MVMTVQAVAIFPNLHRSTVKAIDKRMLVKRDPTGNMHAPILSRGCHQRLSSRQSPENLTMIAAESRSLGGGVPQHEQDLASWLAGSEFLAAAGLSETGPGSFADKGYCFGYPFRSGCSSSSIDTRG